jgi:hypothetical protein
MAEVSHKRRYAPSELIMERVEALKEFAVQLNDRPSQAPVEPSFIAQLAVDKAAQLASEAQLLLDEQDPACRVCGCTEDKPCNGGCHWAEDPQMGDLCSRCVNAALLVTAVDLVDGETETVVVRESDYLLTTTEPCHVHHVQVAGIDASTHVVTIKGVRRG